MSTSSPPPEIPKLADQLWHNFTLARLTASPHRAMCIAIAMTSHQLHLPSLIDEHLLKSDDTNVAQVAPAQNDYSMHALQQVLERMKNDFALSPTDRSSSCSNFPRPNSPSVASNRSVPKQPDGITKDGITKNIRPSRSLTSFQHKNATQQCTSFLKLYRSQFKCTHHRTVSSSSNPCKPKLGCNHYQRGVKLFAKCCKVWVPCRQCHDEAMHGHHKMDRYAVDRVMCMRCMTEQPVSSRCVRCNATFASYFCSVCRFYDDSGRDIYHCPHCKTCRLGKGLGIDNYHCARCDACVSLESKQHHKCHERGLHAECPVCQEDMFSSTEKVVYLRCGHPMHASCFRKYTKTSFKCPYCFVAITDMSAYYASIDNLLQHDANHQQQQQQPPQQQQEQEDEQPRNQQQSPNNRRPQALIHCNDCGSKSLAPSHFLFHKCHAGANCSSYNTRVIEIVEVKQPHTPR